MTFAVGGKTALYYLPLTICERLGYFKEQGLEVTINDFRGGAQSLQALVGGSVDVVTGAYEHTIRMQAKGQDIKAVIELGRFPGIVVGVRKEKAASKRVLAAAPRCFGAAARDPLHPCANPKLRLSVVPTPIEAQCGGPPPPADGRCPPRPEVSAFSESSSSVSAIGLPF